MEQETSGLSTEVLQGIKPFSGTPEDISEQGQMMLSGHTLQKVETQYTTAISVQQHRSLARVVANVLEEANLAGEDFYWGWHVRQKQKDGSYKKVWIDGASIGLANCVARNWGNCATDVVPIDENGTHFMLKAFFVDLETGYNGSRLYRQRKKQTIGMKDLDRQEDIVFQIAQSKVIRNVVTNAMPRWLIKQAVQKAQEAVRKGIGENLSIARSNALRYFMSEGASQERIENAMSRKADEWTPEDIVMLRGMRTAFEEGRVTIDELFPPIEAEPEIPEDRPEGTLGPDNIPDPEAGARPNDPGVEGVAATPAPVISPAKEQSYTCHECGFKAASERGLKKHVTQSHPPETPAEAPNQEPESTEGEEATEAPPETIASQINNIIAELGNGAMRLYKVALESEKIDTWQTATPLQQEAVLKAMQRHLDEKLAED